MIAPSSTSSPKVCSPVYILIAKSMVCSQIFSPPSFRRKEENYSGAGLASKISCLSQGLVPDFKFMLMTPQGPQSFLGELKCINAARTWYGGVNAGKGTERRANQLCKEHESKLRAYNVRYHRAAPLPRGHAASQHPPGPLVQRFRNYEFLK